MASNGASTSEWAFKTGNLRLANYCMAETSMIIDVSSDGQVVGRGGNGRKW